MSNCIQARPPWHQACTALHMIRMTVGVVMQVSGRRTVSPCTVCRRRPLVPRQQLLGLQHPTGSQALPRQAAPAMLLPAI